ncbi:MAG: hypothetical protein COY81_04125 [Candidatus Pacebacteria bacterium CG_4_10_14_0_8_um_filter_43_12]|nr:MAG: hypothetical protein COU66_00625 [Candidatus Pacebacteria bacterium CG10_big_fil_rev_8_21_14_0_10_44_11]PIY79073.1 MAG: hypothetical protein COY81_04125 [Candidatus Pacebacteria bacterium CG_4_10_14_0_8_um_filter_43_12]
MPISQLSPENMSGRYHYSLENLASAMKVVAEAAASLAWPMIIAIDGSAAVGKTQIVEYLKTLGYIQMSKGLLARIYTWVYQSFNFVDRPIEEFAQVARNLEVKTIKKEGKQVVLIESEYVGSHFLDPEGIDDESGLRSDQINQKVSWLSGQSLIVTLIHDHVREIAEKAAKDKQSLVVDGRDSVWTFLDSKLAVAKIYLYAQDHAIRFRAKERYKKKMAHDYPDVPIDPIDLKDVGEKAIQRTREDIHKSDGRLASLEEAYQLLSDGFYDEVIDTTEMTALETFFHILLVQIKIIESLTPGLNQDFLIN